MTQVVYPVGWKIVHADFQRDVFTLERARRWFKGPFRIATGAELQAEALGVSFTLNPAGTPTVRNIS